MTDNLVIVSYHEKGFWQADLYEGLAHLNGDDFEQMGPSPDAFFTGKANETSQDVADRAKQRWPSARLEIVFGDW